VSATSQEISTKPLPHQIWREKRWRSSGAKGVRFVRVWKIGLDSRVTISRVEKYTSANGASRWLTMRRSKSTSIALREFLSRFVFVEHSLP
jgi:hypothetical protein